MMRPDLALLQRRDRERHREIRLAGAGRADAERDGAVADRVDVALLRHRLRRDLLAAVAPDDVVEDVADVLGLVERAEHGVDGRRADLVAALDQLDELVDDGARLGDVLARRPRSSAGCRAAGSCSRSRSRSASSTPSPIAGELGGDVVRDVEDLCCTARSV